MDSFLPLIDDVFTPEMRRWRFMVATRISAAPPDYTDAIRYVNAERSVTIHYAQTQEQWCEVTIGGYGDPELLTDLFSFVRGLSESHEGYVSTNDPALFRQEAERCCALLLRYGKQFLEGDISGFRRSYRELFLVSVVRAARNNANSEKKWSDFARYHRWLEDYWTQDDFKAAESARRRGWSG